MKVALRRPLPAEVAAALTGAQLRGKSARILSVITDARESSPGALFCALPGERTDGHLYIRQAAESGCSAVLCRCCPTEAENMLACLCVPSVEEALFKWAAALRAGYLHPVIAVTGSMGKTTQKEFLRTLLSPLGPVFATPGNHNSTLGVPLSLLALDGKYKTAVTELGMNHPGEIGRLSRLVRPHVGVITAIGSAHIGLLGSREAICRAKCEITEGMQGGPVWIPARESLLARWDYPHKITFGTPETRPDVAFSYSPCGDESDFSLLLPSGEHLCGRLPFADEPSVLAALRGAAIAHNMGVKAGDIVQLLPRLQKPASRMEILRGGGILLLNDAYNASPEAVRSALRFLSALRITGKRYAILGQMMELGRFSARLHREIGREAAACGLREVWFVGEDAAAFVKGTTEGGMPSFSVHVTDQAIDPEKTATDLARLLCPGDALLIKGSHGTGLHRLAQMILSKKE